MTAADLTDYLDRMKNLLSQAKREDYPQRWLACRAASAEMQLERAMQLLREQATAAAPKRKRTRKAV